MFSTSDCEWVFSTTQLLGNQYNYKINLPCSTLLIREFKSLSHSFKGWFVCKILYISWLSKIKQIISINIKKRTKRRSLWHSLNQLLSWTKLSIYFCPVSSIFKEVLVIRYWSHIHKAWICDHFLLYQRP